jgi:hypothetical protein
MKNQISHKFALLKEEGKLDLKTKNSNALVDFLSVLPEMVTTAVQNEKIMKGFIGPGMINGKFNKYPDFNKMLATCRRNPTRDEYTTCYSSFIELFNSFGRIGGLEDDVWERLGFPVDKNIHGDNVRRLATISQEHQ